MGGITGTPLGTTRGVSAGRRPVGRGWFIRGWVLGWNSGYPTRNHPRAGPQVGALSGASGSEGVSATGLGPESSVRLEHATPGWSMRCPDGARNARLEHAMPDWSGSLLPAPWRQRKTPTPNGVGANPQNCLLATASILQKEHSRPLRCGSAPPGSAPGGKGASTCYYFLALPWLATASILAAMTSGSPMYFFSTTFQSWSKV